jgi:hypothetical protein
MKTPNPSDWVAVACWRRYLLGGVTLGWRGGDQAGQWLLMVVCSMVRRATVAGLSFLVVGVDTSLVVSPFWRFLPSVAS